MLRFATITNMAPISIPYIHLLLAMTELAGLFLVVIFIFRYKHQLVLNSWLFSKKKLHAEQVCTVHSDLDGVILSENCRSIKMGCS
mgnify:CR=1 FL=1